MLFNSTTFILLFLPATFLVFVVLQRLRRGRTLCGFLVLSSLFYYAYWNTSYLLIILLSIGFNYGASKFLLGTKPQQIKKACLWISIAANLCLLGYYKYFFFVVDNINFVFDLDLSFPKHLLPLAISFFTFQQISFLVDVYQEKITKINLLDYSLFVTFFPQLIAGPIVHHSEMMPQFKKVTKIKLKTKLFTGSFLFLIGLSKKMILADSLAIYAEHGYQNATALDFLSGWITCLSYSFQLYFDFSGYSDMALGVALLFGIHLPANFYSPYKSVNLQEFWRRWHITLSRWLRDYLYIPFGGNRINSLITTRNLILTFLLGGIWHGAGWTFVTWGLIHGVGVSLSILLKNVRVKVPKAIAITSTFLTVSIAWVFFRAESLQDALNVLKAQFFLNGMDLEIVGQDINNIASLANETATENFHLTDSSVIMPLVWISISAYLVFASPNSIQQTIEKKKPNIPMIFHWVALAFLCILFSSSIENSPFLYFNF